MNDLHHYYFVKNSMNWVNKRLNSNYLRIIDLEKDEYVYTITTKQWRLPNAGFIKILVSNCDKKYLAYLYKNDVAFIQDENNPDEIFLLRILTEQECYQLMGFNKSDFDKVVKCFEGLEVKR